MFVLYYKKTYWYVFFCNSMREQCLCLEAGYSCAATIGRGATGSEFSADVPIYHSNMAEEATHVYVQQDCKSAYSCTTLYSS